MITTPGFYFDIAAADYFADPCPTPSLTQSIAKLLIERSPLHAWTAHPRLNPDFEPDDSREFDVGNICHKLLIGRGKELVVLDQFDDWRTKEARALREAAAAEGRLAVLGKHYALADHIVGAAREQLALRHLAHLFNDGAGEVMTAWLDEMGGPQPATLWCRQLIDWLTHDRATMVDYKTTRESAAPHMLARKMVNDGWDIQAAMAERGLRALDGYNSPLRFLFVVQETEAPFALSVVELSESALTMGRKKLDVAFALWRRCIEENRWPGYPTEIVVPEYPAFAEAQWLDREQTEFAA